MRDALKWMRGALSSRGLNTEHTLYKLADSEIKATNGKLIAGHPCLTGVDFLVPGDEFEKVIVRLPGDITLKAVKKDDKPIAIRLRSGAFSGTVNTMPLENWSFPGVDEAVWHPIPQKLCDVLQELRPFISDEGAHIWATCVAIENGWAYATNNVAIAGARLAGTENMMAMLPAWAVDFVLARREGLVEWAWADNYVAFRWDNDAWMRSVLVVGKFTEKAATMVRSAFEAKTTTKITQEFRDVLLDLCEMAEKTVLLYKDCIIARYKEAEVTASITCEVPVPESSDHSIWKAKFLLPVIEVAESWSPDAWPNPAPFKGKSISGFIIGRVS